MRVRKEKKKQRLFDLLPDEPKQEQDRTRLVQSHYRCVHQNCGGRIPIKENICPECGKTQKTQADF